MKASKESVKKIESDSDSDYEEIDPQVAVQFIKQFKLFVKGKKTNVKIPKHDGKKKSSKWTQCYECHGFGYVVSDCSSRKSKKKL